LYKSKVDEATEGDADAAMWLIKEFRSSIRYNLERLASAEKPSCCEMYFNPELLEYFLGCFSKLSEQKGDGGKRITADIALNLSTKGRGPKATSSTRHKHASWGILVQQERNLTLATLGTHVNGMTALDFAIQKVAQDELVGEDSIRAAYSKWAALLKSQCK
jgi:hypothetical protein